MTPEQAKFTIVQLYDQDYPMDLTSAGHPDKAATLCRIVKMLVDGQAFNDIDNQEAIALATFMQAVSGQSQ